MPFGKKVFLIVTLLLLTLPSNNVKAEQILIKKASFMINNSSIQKWQRLQAKQLDQQFLQEVQQGCNCSSFEASAILDTVRQVYSPFFDNASSLQPGQLQMTVISADCPPNQALKEATLVTVNLTLFDDRTDVAIRKKSGIVGLRHHRLERLCREAFQQGGLLTVEDLANRLLNCGQRTLCRDLKTLKDKGILLPLRSTIKDMGRTLSHRVDIVRLWLLGKEYTEISRATFHSVASVRNYVSKFKRVVSLTKEKYDEYTISFLVKISSALVQQYQKMYQNLDIVPHREEELTNISKKNNRTY